MRNRILLALVAILGLAAAALAIPIPVYQPVPDAPGVALVPQPVGGPYEQWADLVVRDASGAVVGVAARLRYEDGLIHLQLIPQAPGTPGDLWRRNGSGYVLVVQGDEPLNP
jgi:hypothetical protein